MSTSNLSVDADLARRLGALTIGPASPSKCYRVVHQDQRVEIIDSWSHAASASQGIPGARVNAIPLTPNRRSRNTHNWPFYAVTIGVTPGIYRHWDKVKKMTSGVRCQTAKGYPSLEEASTAFTHAVVDNKVFAANSRQTPSARLRASTSTHAPPTPMVHNRAAVPPNRWYLTIPNADPIPEGPRWIVLFQAADVGVFGPGEYEMGAGAIMNVKGALWRVFNNIDVAHRAFDDALADDVVDVVVNDEWESD